MLLILEKREKDVMYNEIKHLNKLVILLPGALEIAIYWKNVFVNVNITNN